MFHVKHNYPENAEQKLSTVLEQIAVSLTQDAKEKLISYYEILVERNKSMNLTAITEFDDVIRKHFADSLAPLSFPNLKDIFQKKDGKILDLGTGAGFPGIPLAIALPDAKFTLADSLQKRTAFLEEVKEMLHLEKVNILNGRAEDIGKDSEYRGCYDIVVSRAVADMRILCEYCLPFVKIGGVFASWKGPGVYEETETAGNAIETLGGKTSMIQEYALPGLSEQRTLCVIKKVKETPEKYPRRAGIPAKRPL